MRRSPALLAALAAVLLVARAPAAAAAEPVAYRPPVDAPLVDRFRPPASAYGAGNRGVDYATEPGQEVRAAADGEVVFAGRVGASLHVVVLHADGVRTTSAFVAEVLVRRGDRVVGGQVVARAGPSLHLGARVGEAYLDPLELFGGAPVEVRLVPDEVRRPASEQEERGALSRLLRGVGRRVGGISAEAVRWAGAGTARLARPDVMAAWLAVARDLGVPDVVRLAAATRAWLDQRDACTPPGEAPPAPGVRRIAVLVAGLGSSGPDGGAAFAIDTAALGYAAGDVARFSYRGGDARTNPYGPADTQIDIGVAAGRLRALIADVAARHPGVPIDVLAHSQGGLVARAAITADVRTPLPVTTLVTLATPHRGAPLATAGVLLGGRASGRAAKAVADRIAPGGIRPGSTSVAQLAEGSRFLRDLAGRPLPTSTRVVSVAARYDPIVPSVDCLLPGADNVTVSTSALPLADHDALPRSVAARREIALAIAGRPPTCQSLPDALVDAAIGIGIDKAEALAGASVGLAAP